MNKGDLVEAIAKQTDLSKFGAEALVNAFVSTVAGALKIRDRVTLTGFGTFSVHGAQPRMGREPRTMKKEDLVEAVAERAALRKSRAEAGVNALVVATNRALKSGDTVTIRGFGTFSVSRRRRATAGGPRLYTGRTTARFKPSIPFEFTAAKALIDLVSADIERYLKPRELSHFMGPGETYSRGVKKLISEAEAFYERGQKEKADKLYLRAIDLEPTLIVDALEGEIKDTPLRRGQGTIKDLFTYLATR